MYVCVWDFAKNCRLLSEKGCNIYQQRMNACSTLGWDFTKVVVIKEKKNPNELMAQRDQRLF